jgi:hypothetical protein
VTSDRKDETIDIHTTAGRNWYRSYRAWAGLHDIWASGTEFREKIEVHDNYIDGLAVRENKNLM